MSALNNSLLLGQEGGGGYAISRSLRFNSSDSAYLSRTPASAGNRKTWTWAGWVKRSALGVNAALFGRQQSDDTNTLDIRFGTGDTLRLANWNAYILETAQVFRDTSAWFHLVVVLDTTQATANNRARMYVNGAEITQFGTRSNPAQNADLAINNTTLHHLGATVSGGGGATYHFPGYLADIHFIDGQALDPTSFGEFDDNGIWQPKAYTGSYGTNGFHLDFADNSSAAALGYDAAGSNDWTVNNISVAAGAGNDSLVDVPTNGSEVDTGVGGEVRGNYCCWNPLDNNTKSTGGNGNLEAVITGADALYGNIRATHGISEKTYWETVVAGTSRIYQYHGIAPSDSSLVASGSGGIGYTNVANSVGVYCQDGTVYVSGSSVLTQSLSITTGDILMHAYDPLSGKYWAGRNGTWFNSGNPAAGTGQVTTLSTAKQWMPAVSSASTQTITTNFGQRPFAYTAPSGFKALCTANLPAPVITKPSTVMDVALYTGTGSTQTVSGLGFSPDLVWIKSRSQAFNHGLYDTVRGATNRLISSSTAAEDTLSGVTAFNSNGFTMGGADGTNGSTYTYAAWAWDAGSSTVTDNTGSIQSSRRTNASAGISIVSYTGSGSSATVGHGLGVAPSWIIIKNRTTSYDWIVYANESGTLKQLYLNLTLASSGAGLSLPSSTTFNLAGGGATGSNGSGDNYVAYCFAPVAGYSAMGSYVGNNSADGPFCFTGFRPRWLLIKSSSYAADWIIIDAARETYNVMSKALFPNRDYYEAQSSTNLRIDFLSNGFKIRSTDGNAEGWNYPSNTHIWAAFAESPFQYARAR